MEHKGNNNVDNGNTNNSNSDTTQRDTNDNNTRDFYISQSEPPGSSLPVSSPPSSSTPLVTSPFHEQSLAAPVTTSSPTSTTNMSNVSPPNPSTNNNSNNTTTSTTATPAATHKTQAAFVNKLYTMVEDQSIQHLISWAPSGDVFSVSNPTEFSKSVLPQYFKHNNWQSFVRQLNMYGFHKVNDMFHANPSSESQAWEFKHPDFRRGQLLALQNIKRKSSKPSTTSSNLKGISGGTGPGQSPLADIDMRDDRIECLTNQMSELMDKMRQMHENYGLLYAETVSCRMLQSKHQQVITTITSLLTSMTREDDSNDPRSLKRKFEMDLLTAEVAKLGQSDMQPPSHSPMMQHPSSHYPREHPTRSMSTPQPMVGLEHTPMHSQMPDIDYRVQPFSSGSGHHRQQKVQTSSPLAMLPEIPFPSFPSNNYLRHRSPEPISGVSPSNSRSASLDTYSRSVSISQSSTHTASSQYSQTNSHSSHMTPPLPSPPTRRSSQPSSSLSFGSDSNLLNPSENNRYKDNNSSITQSQSQQQRPPSSSSSSPTPFKSENPAVNNPSTSQTRAPPIPDPPDEEFVKRRKRN